MRGAGKVRWATLGAAVAMLLAGVGPVAAHHHGVIQPGAEMVEPSGCTMNFVFQDQGGTTYIGTAGHCVDFEGQNVWIDALDRSIGQVAWTDYWGGDDVDFALVEIEDALLDRVDPQMRHWGGPTGVAFQDETAVGDRVQHYGHGIGFEVSEVTRPRGGVLVEHGGLTYCADTPVDWGDSGSPITTADGEALGVVTRLGVFCAPTTSLEGPTMGAILDEAKEEKGLDLDVVTAPLTDVDQREIDRIQHLCGSSGCT